MSTIGVRCAAAHTALWFYLEEGYEFSAQTIHRRFNAGGKGEAFHKLLGTEQPWAELFPLGVVIVEAVLRIQGVEAIDVRPNYISVDVRNAAEWRRILPAIVQILRKNIDDPDARVVVEPSVAPGVEHWHADLLQELFG